MMYYPKTRSSPLVLVLTILVITSSRPSSAACADNPPMLTTVATLISKSLHRRPSIRWVMSKRLRALTSLLRSPLHHHPLDTLSSIDITTRGLGAGRWIGVIPRTDRDEHVDEDTQRTLEVVALLVSEEVADHDDSEDQDDRVEDFKVQAHVLVKAPAHEHDEGSVEQSGLDGSAENVGEGEVHLVVVSFVHGCDVFGYLFDDGDEDQTHETVAYALVFDNPL